MFFSSSFSAEGDGLFERLAGEVVGEGGRFFGRETEVKEHENLFVFGEAERLVEGIDVDTVEPAGIHAGILGSQHQVGGNDGSVFDARLALVIGIGIDIVLVKRHDQHGGSAVAAGSAGVNLCQSLRGLTDIDVLFLQILGGGGQTAGVEDVSELLLTDLSAAVKGFA